MTSMKADPLSIERQGGQQIVSTRVSLSTRIKRQQIKPADGSITFSQRIHFFLRHTMQLCDPLLLVIADPVGLPGFKTHKINSLKEKVTFVQIEKDKIHEGKYCCDKEDLENSKEKQQISLVFQCLAITSVTHTAPLHCCLPCSTGKDLFKGGAVPATSAEAPSNTFLTASLKNCLL